jgi:valyl-tRNA synthetase
MASAYAALAHGIDRLARVRGTLVPGREALPAGADTLVVVGRDVEVRLSASAADLARDRARLEREIAELEGHLDAVRARLADDRFVTRAPAPVVEGVRARAAEIEERLARLRENRAGPGPG